VNYLEYFFLFTIGIRKSFIFKLSFMKTFYTLCHKKFRRENFVCRFNDIVVSFLIYYHQEKESEIFIWKNYILMCVREMQQLENFLLQDDCDIKTASRILAGKKIICKSPDRVLYTFDNFSFFVDTNFFFFLFFF
jgi:hypothetical protein